MILICSLMQFHYNPLLNFPISPRSFNSCSTFMNVVISEKYVWYSLAYAHPRPPSPAVPPGRTPDRRHPPPPPYRSTSRLPQIPRHRLHHENPALLVVPVSPVQLSARARTAPSGPRPCGPRLLGHGTILDLIEGLPCIANCLAASYIS
jgi:hypothetical protein